MPQVPAYLSRRHISHLEPILKQLEFTDCPHCGKRVAKTARQCAHCGHSPSGDNESVQDNSTGRPGRSGRTERGQRNAEQPDPDQAESHFSTGGHDEANDDFDYDEYLEDEFDENPNGPTKRNLWWYVALILLILFTITAFIPAF